MAVIKNKRILKCLLMVVVSLLLVLNFSIGVSASTVYDRQDADACITISQRLSVKGGSKPDFYVKPNGETVPSTGYRYVSENASYLDSMSESMTIPANEEGTYFSFDCYDEANPGALQVPHDASIRVEFDTLQIIDDISVPNGNWGKASYLEPITKDFPEFGKGGATQVITRSRIIIDLITKLSKH